jgi:hypothetical protein
MEVVHVKPVDGKRVMDPSQNPPIPLPPEGGKVVWSVYWSRRLADGDVVKVVKAKEAKAVKEPDPDRPEKPAAQAKVNKVDKSDK